jgi:hypothetical protein
MSRLVMSAVVGVWLLAGSAAAADLQVGQTWSCSSADPARQLFVTIGRVEPYGKGTVVHVSLFNRAPGAVPGELAHAPIDLEVLLKSCPKIETPSIPLSSRFEGGYGQWRDAHGGVFTIPVERIYGIVVDQVAKARQGGLNVQ